jgi:hypothetical protein
MWTCGQYIIAMRRFGKPIGVNWTRVQLYGNDGLNYLKETDSVLWYKLNGDDDEQQQRITNQKYRNVQFTHVNTFISVSQAYRSQLRFYQNVFDVF